MNDEWRTPPWLFARLSAEYGPFDLDAAATRRNTLCPSFWTAKDDALTQPWEGRVFCNPPYSKGAGPLNRWMEKAWEENRIRRAAIVVMLFPLDATAWWAKAFIRAKEVVLFDGRVGFNRPDGTPGNGNRAGSTVFVFRGNRPINGPEVHIWPVPGGRLL